MRKSAPHSLDLPAAHNIAFLAYQEPVTDDRIESVDSGRIEGRNAVTEALKRGRPIDKLFVSEEGDSSLRHLASIAAERGIPVVRVSRKKLDSMSLSHAHQGVIAVAAAAEYASIMTYSPGATERASPLIVVSTVYRTPESQAIVRSAECAEPTGVYQEAQRRADGSGGKPRRAPGYIPIVRVPT